eukprot:scaffold655_cov379-Prasinococcus_capsulatus_cf.AAC.28
MASAIPSRAAAAARDGAAAAAALYRARPRGRGNVGAGGRGDARTPRGVAWARGRDACFGQWPEALRCAASRARCGWPYVAGGAENRTRAGV